MALMDWDTPPSIQQRQTRVFRAQAQRIVQRKKTERNLRDAAMFRKEARSVQRDMGLRRTEAKGFREDAQGWLDTLNKRMLPETTKKKDRGPLGILKKGILEPAETLTLGAPGLFAQAIGRGESPQEAVVGVGERYTRPGISAEESPVRRVPIVGRSAANVTSGLMSPIGALTAGLAGPAGTGAGTLGSIGLGSAGGVAEEEAGLPYGRLGGEIIGGFAPAGALSAPGRALTRAGAANLGERSIRAFPTRNSNEVGNGIRELTTGARSELGTDLLKWRPRGEVGHIITVNVPEAARGQGRAQVLIDQALEDMQRQGLRNATAEVETPAGARMLRRHGATFEDRMGTPLSLEEAQERANRGVYATIQLGERRRSAQGLIASEVGGSRLPDEPMSNTLTGWRNYRKQLEGTVVTDGERPKVVYHGSNSPIRTFDDALLGENTASRNTALGHFFTDDYNWAADLYAGKRGSVTESWIDIKKPLRISETGEWAQDPAIALDNVAREWGDGVDDFVGARESLQRAGYDGIIYTANPGTRYEVTTYIPLSSKQVYPVRAGPPYGDTQALGPGTYGPGPEFEGYKPRTPEEVGDIPTIGPDEGLPRGPVPDFGPDAPDIEAMLSQQGANRRRMGEEFRGDFEPPREPPTGVADMGEVPEDPFESARQAILNARDINVAERQRLRPVQYEETGRRIGAYESEYQAALKEGLSRQEAQRQAQAALGGEKLKTSPIDVNLDEAQKQAIWDKIDKFDFGRGTGPDYERFRVRSALGKLSFGERLTEGEWIGLEKVLGKDVTGVLKAAQSEKTGSLNRLLEVALVPKAVLSAFDVSYPLRQGIMLGPRHPKEFGGNLPGMFKAFASEEAAQNIQRSILEDAYPILLKNGEEIPFNQFVEETSLIRPLETGLTESEEAFQSQLAEKIPGLGRVVRASNRSFTTYGNKLRADVAKNIVKAWNESGGSSMQDLQALSDMLNRFSGRGTLVGKERLSGLAKDFNNFAEAVFWAPKYRVSGPQAFAQMFNVRNPRVANQAIQNFGPYMAAGSALLGLAALNGLNVTLDPRSTDFGKVVFGNQRFNFWGTNQLLVRSLAQIYSGERIDPDTGLTKPIEWGKVVERYARSGLAPEWSAIYDAIAGETYIGQEFPPSSKDEWITQAKEKLTPLFIQDVYDTAKYGDWRTLPIVAPAAALGGSFQAYEQSATGKLDAIQQYEGIDEQTQYDITKQGGFLDQVSEERNRMVQSGTPQGDLPEVSQSIIEIGEAQGLPESFIQAALYLNSEKWRTQHRTDEWYDFVIDNEDQLRDENPRMFSQWLNEFLNMNRDKRLQETR